MYLNLHARKWQMLQTWAFVFNFESFSKQFQSISESNLNGTMTPSAWHYDTQCLVRLWMTRLMVCMQVCNLREMVWIGDILVWIHTEVS